MNSKIYGKLAVTNIRNNRKTYVPFILTSVLSVMMYGIIDTLSQNDTLGNQNIKTVLDLATGVTALFCVIFLFYTNSFLIKRRKKEIAVYNILGMGKGHIGRMLTVETLLTGVASIGAGLLGSLIFGKLMHMLLVRILRFDTGVAFRISGASLLRTVILFAGIFFLTWLYNLFQVRSVSTVELLRGGEAGEKEPKTKWLLALVGAAALGAGYYLALSTERPIEALETFFVAVVLVIIGTYALFLAGSIALLKFLKKRKHYYYTPGHFTAVSGMIYRMKQNAAGLASICVLSTIVLVMISSTVSLYAGMEDILDHRFPYDYGILTVQGTNPSCSSQIKEIVAEETAAQDVTRQGELSFRYGATAVLKEGKDAFTNQVEGDYVSAGLQEMYLIPQEDYHLFQEDSTTLASDEVMVFVTDGRYGQDTIRLNGKEYKVKKELKEFRLEEKSEDRVMTAYYVIMPDEQSILEMQIPGGTLQYSLYFDMKGTKKNCDTVIRNLQKRIETEVPGAVCENRKLSEQSFYSLYGSLFFIGLYLGSMFLIATVLIIYYKQISEGFDDRQRYQIMQKVGMGKREVRRSIRSQILLVFFLPLAAAVLHTAVAFQVVDKLLQMLGLVNTPLFFGCTAATVLVFALFYVAVFGITAREYYKIVNA